MFSYLRDIQRLPRQVTPATLSRKGNFCYAYACHPFTKGGFLFSISIITNRRKAISRIRINQRIIPPSRQTCQTGIYTYNEKAFEQRFIMLIVDELTTMALRRCKVRKE
ncbi:MAG TPA: hypothetical protein PLX23_08160 [Candidatus Hydrogenedens sp.]|nr:hypothetical protein [Candidatus Hydrogenedens sp.]